MADEVLPEMQAFYTSLETKFNAKLITQRNIVKLFSEEQEIALWKKKAQAQLTDYLDPLIHNELLHQHIITKGLYSKVTVSGNLDVISFLNYARDYLITKNSYLDEFFDYSQLQISDKVSYKTICATSIVFAEGHLIKQNPFFNYLPMKPVKGEVINIKVPGLEIGTDIVNKNAFLMACGKDEFKVGATYNWTDLTDTTTPGGLQELQVKLANIISCHYTVLSQQAGVRPSVIDRRPIIGRHPKYNNLFVFNGMGTKGVMLAPYFADRFIQFYLKEKPLNFETDINRFQKFYVN